MSHIASAWATEQLLPCAPKMVLMMLADRHNKETGLCLYSIRSLARDCGLSPFGVQKILPRLEKLGLIKKLRRRSSDKKVALTSQYILNLQTAAAALANTAPDDAPTIAALQDYPEAKEVSPGIFEIKGGTLLSSTGKYLGQRGVTRGPAHRKRGRT